MHDKRRLHFALVLFGALVAILALSTFSPALHRAPEQSVGDSEIIVSSGADRGPGSLREALFAADLASGKVRIVIRAKKISLETPLPPLLGRRGMMLVAEPKMGEIDAAALTMGPVFDVNGADISIAGLTIRHCVQAAVLVRAHRFELSGTTIDACDVGVDVANNVADLTLQRNRFTNARIGVRLSASSRNTAITANAFAHSTEAGISGIRTELDVPGARAVMVRDNRFHEDRVGIAVSNLSISIERNLFDSPREAAIQISGSGADVRSNRVTGGNAHGIVAEDARAVTIDSNEIDHVPVYGIVVRDSAKLLVQANRVHNGGYGIAFILGSTAEPSTATDNLILGQQLDGLVVIGDSPVLRRNRVVQTEGIAIRVQDFTPPNGPKVISRPFLDGNEPAERVAAQ